MIYIIVGYYGDQSGARLLGAYENADEANDRAAIAGAASAAMTVRVIQMKIGVCDPQEVFA